MTISLDDGTAKAYEKQAKATGVPLEELLSQRLTSCEKYTSEKPLYVTDEQRRVLEKVIGKNLNSPTQLVTEVQDAVMLRVSGTIVNLGTPLLKRIKSRAHHVTVKELIQTQVKRDLEAFVGLR